MSVTPRLQPKWTLARAGGEGEGRLPPNVLLLEAPCAELCWSELAPDLQSVKGGQRSPGPNASARLCIERTFIVALNGGQAQAARGGWKGHLENVPFEVRCCSGPAGCGREPNSHHQRGRLLFRGEGPTFEVLYEHCYTSENLFPGKFYVAKTKENGLMWVLPTPLRVAI